MVTDGWSGYAKIVNSIKSSTLLWHRVVVGKYLPCLEALQYSGQALWPSKRLHSRHGALIVETLYAILIRVLKLVVGVLIAIARLRHVQSTHVTTTHTI